MSKQPARRSRSGKATPAPRQDQTPPSTGSVTTKQTVNTRIGPGKSAPTTSSTRMQTRPPVAVVRKKPGFRLRPLDIGLIAAGLLVVGFIVWSGLNTTGNTTLGVANEATTGDTPGSAPDRPTPIPVGQPGPDFSLPAPDGNTYSLSQFKGKTVLLEFFAPWCPHCQDDAPMFNRVHEAYKDKGVQVLAVSASPWGREYAPPNTRPPITMEDVTWFRDTYEVPFPMLFDQEVKTAEAYGVLYYPTLYIVNKDGIVVSQPTGGYTWGEGDEPQSNRTTALTEEELAGELDKAIGEGGSN